ncbi:lipoprotein signal peptidase [Endozoicomonas sp. G2_2]|uniref:signal peptidase II n=1 Tax=Gammaproteobacteria TaxID=1236 RepID=UPI000C5CDC62|nr:MULTISPECIES: signal peptidase II [Gammaproteobacteria]MAS09314.1 signal peptidase II [Salinisphaera sp.]MBO9469249.1 lipoprotein signal peptidase [Endozoicomonas sp. G2_2]
MTSSSDKSAAHDERGFQLQNAHWLWLSAIVIAADQITKQLVVNQLELFDRIHLFDWLNLTLMHNTGAAFSIFAGATPWFFVALSVLVSIGILVWMRRHPHGERLVASSLALILGGALGNAIDRATRGYVIDFVDFHIHGWHYPAFNVADSAIVLGAILLGLDMLRPRRG